ncbi:MAG: 4a-hydroxytetrahydrobiopterin dehydratase [Novipirellula sp. JB048]
MSESNSKADSSPDSTLDATALRASKCVPCEGGVPKLDRQQASELIAATPGWELGEDANRISRKLKCRDFAAAVAQLNKIAALAEQEQHHPDLHLTGYRHLGIELTTHAIGGLSMNDFVLAAKIDAALDSKP